MNLLFWYRSLMRSVGAALVKLIATATSGIVSFTTNVIRPVKVVCEFSPIQEGTGDPSPDNVRPISGWTGCEITRTGGNLLSPDDTGYGNYTIGPTGNHTTGDYARLSSGFIPVSKGDVLTLGTWISLYKNLGFGFAGIAIYDKDKQFVRREAGNGSWSFTATIGEGEKYVRAFSQFEPESKSAILTPSVWSRYKIQLERASSRTTYESYIGSTLPITFTDPSTGDPMTVYGGTVTLNEDGSVDLVKTHEYALFDGSSDESISKYRSGSASAFAMSLGLKKNARGNLTSSNLSNIRSNYLKTITTNETWGNYNAFVSVTASASRPTIECGIKTITTVADFRAYLAENPLQIAYRLYSPQTYHFPNIGRLNSFLGTNNIWHDMNGGITAEYWNKQ